MKEYLCAEVDAGQVKDMIKRQKANKEVTRHEEGTKKRKSRRRTCANNW